MGVGVGGAALGFHICLYQSTGIRGIVLTLQFKLVRKLNV